MKKKLLSILFAYFALVNAEGVVENVIRDDLGIIAKNAPDGKVYIETFRDGRKKKRFAAIRGTLDKKIDAFLPPKTFQSWVLNEKEAKWEPPTPEPKDGKKYYWDEPTRAWKKLPEGL